MTSREIEASGINEHVIDQKKSRIKLFSEIYDWNDFRIFLHRIQENSPIISLQSLEDLMEHDKQREQDGFPRKIRLGKLIKPSDGTKGQVVVVPTTTEPKFYHDPSITEDGEGQPTGGAGEGEEGEVLGEQPADQDGEEGEGQGAGEGSGGEHDIISDAFDVGKVLTEKFELPNVHEKGKKYSITKYKYDLTDKNRGFGQILDKKATLKRIIETNILLGNIQQNEPFEPENLVLNPQDQIFRIMSKEKDYETQAVVFFVRDYSGSMQGKPTEIITSQHLLIYSWLMYQYQRNVTTRFILHDTEAKEVPDFYTYYKYQVAGGTNVYPAYELVNKIVSEEKLAHDNNIYVFHGTDGDDWENNGTKMLAAVEQMLTYASRVGITIAKNDYSSGETTVEQYVNKSGLLDTKPKLIRLDSFSAAEASEVRVIEGIRKLVS